MIGTHARRWAAAALVIGMAQIGPAQERANVTPDQVKRACDMIVPYIEKSLKTSGVPGASIVVVYRGEVMLLDGFGVRKLGGEPVTKDTVFQLASMSKPISSTVLARLVSLGKIQWGMPVSKLDPDFKLMGEDMKTTPTLRNMYSHTSGLPGYAGNDLEEMGYSRSEILRRLRYVPLQPGGYDYSNFALTEGAVAAVKSLPHTTWEQVADDYLFKPLNMASTSARDDVFEQRANRAYLHIKLDGVWTQKLSRHPTAQSPAGGTSSNVVDLAEWMKLQLANGKYKGSQLISEAALAETHSMIVSNGPGFYGLGWAVKDRHSGSAGLQRLWNHSGAFSVGARTAVYLLPGLELGIAVLTNAFPTGIPEAVSETFVDYVTDGKASEDWLKKWDALFDSFETEARNQAAKYANPPTPVKPAQPNAVYLGTYSNDYYGDMTVVEKDGGLVLQMGPSKLPFPLKHYWGDEFVYFSSPEWPFCPSGIRFSFVADTASIELLDGGLKGVAVLNRTSR